jgi:hypothetical protein
MCGDDKTAGAGCGAQCAVRQGSSASRVGQVDGLGAGWVSGNSTLSQVLRPLPRRECTIDNYSNYDSRPYFRGPPTPLKSSLELPKFSLPSDTHHPLKTAGIRGFWPRYARLETTHPPKVGQQQPGSTPTHPPADSEVCYHNYTAPANEQRTGPWRSGTNH